MIKRILGTIAFLMSFLLITPSIVASTGAEILTSTESPQISANKLSEPLNGISLSVRDFNIAFSEQTDTSNTTKLSSTVGELTLDIGEVTTYENNDSVDIAVTLSQYSSPASLILSGNIKRSFYNERYGSNVIAIDFGFESKTDSKDFQPIVMYLFRKGVADENMLAVDTCTENMVQFIAYSSVHDQLILFEGVEPASLSNIRNVSAGEYSTGEISWIHEFITPNETEVANDPMIIEKFQRELHDSIESVFGGIAPLGLGTSTIHLLRNSGYYREFIVGGTLYYSMSLPYIVERYVNLNNNDSTWELIFEIAEHSGIKGLSSYTQYGNNVIKYRDLELGMGGGGARVLRTYFQGRVYDWQSTKLIDQGKSLATSLLVSAANQLLGRTVPFGTIINNLSALTSTGSTIYLGTNTIELASPTKSSAGVKMIKNHELQECTSHSDRTRNGHYLQFQSIMTNGANHVGSANGVMRVKVNVYDYTKTNYWDPLESINKNVQFTFTHSR